MSPYTDQMVTYTGTQKIVRNITYSDYGEDMVMFKALIPLLTSLMVQLRLSGVQKLKVKNSPYYFTSGSRAHIHCFVSPGQIVDIIDFNQESKCFRCWERDIANNYAEFGTPFEYFELPEWISVAMKLWE